VLSKILKEIEAEIYLKGIRQILSKSLLGKKMDEQRFVDEVQSYFLMKEKDTHHETETGLGIINPYVIYLNNTKVGCMYLDWNENLIENHVGISYIYIYEQNIGYGTKVLSKVCRLADIYRITLFLDAVPQKPTNDSISQQVLKSWYTSFNFIHSEVRGSNDMERKPNA